MQGVHDQAADDAGRNVFGLPHPVTDNACHRRAVIGRSDDNKPYGPTAWPIVRLIGRLAMAVASATTIVMRMLSRVAGRRARTDRRAIEAARARVGLLAPGLSERPGVTRARGRAVEREKGAVPSFSTIGVAPEFGPRDYAATFAALQAPPFSKLLDLVSARLLCADVFEDLADAWIAGPDAVPRLGILLSFERWVILGNVALTALQPLAARGVRVNVFYAEQALAGHLAAWFAYGQYLHNVSAVVARLTEDWHPSQNSSLVLDVLARLVHAENSIAALPRLLTQMAALALSCGDADRAATYAREALLVMPETPSTTRCQALRELGTALIGQGQSAAGLALLKEASTMATQANAPDIGATALCHNGLYELNHGDFQGAERRFREAIELLSADGRRRHQLAFAHHNLAVALMQQGHPDAEYHAETALTLRPDPETHFAEQDRLLLAKLRALRRDSAESNRRGDGATSVDPLVSEALPPSATSEANA